jgi:hypothetical protein
LSQRIIVMNRAAEQPFGTFAEGTLSAAAICDACGKETAWGRLFSDTTDRLVMDRRLRQIQVRLTDLLRKILSFSRPDQQEKAAASVNTVVDEILANNRS